MMLKSFTFTVPEGPYAGDHHIAASDEASAVERMNTWLEETTDGATPPTVTLAQITASSDLEETTITFVVEHEDVITLPAHLPAACPKCSSNQLHSVEVLEATCPLRQHDDGSYDFDDETCIDWESQKTATDDNCLPVIECHKCFQLFTHPGIDML